MDDPSAVSYFNHDSLNQIREHAQHGGKRTLQVMKDLGWLEDSIQPGFNL